jgi:hypothetical protein
MTPRTISTIATIPTHPLTTTTALNLLIDTPSPREFSIVLRGVALADGLPLRS